MIEEWKQIEEDKRYEVSNFGRFRKRNPKNGYRYFKPFRNKNKFVIKINGKVKTCARLVAHYHIRPLTSKECVYHKNKMEFDNFVYNLKIIDKKTLGKLTGHISKSQRVVEVKDGEIVREWRSTRQAAKELFISYQTVSDYCNFKVKKPMYNLMFEEDYYSIWFD